MKKYLLTTVCFLFLSINLLGQDSLLVHTDIQKLTNIYSIYESYSELYDLDGNEDISVLENVSKIDHIIDSISNWNTLNNLERIKLLKREPGLTGTFGYVENLTPNSGEPEENVIYDRRIQLGLEWDILKSGFTDSYFKRKALEEQTSFNEYADQTEDVRPGFIRQMNEIITLFNSKKIDILDAREKYINQEDSIVKNLFLLKQIPYADYINIQSRRAEIKGMQSIYTSYNKYSDAKLKSVESDRLPLIDLNYSFLGSILTESDTQIVNQFNWEKVANLNNKWWNEISAKLYTRYNFYDLAQNDPQDPATRSFFSLGLNLRIPLIFNHKIKKNIELISYQKKYDGFRDIQQHQKEEVLNLVYEFRYKLKQYINTYQKKLVFQELLRRENVKLEFEDADFNPIKGINLVDDILRVDIELHDLLQNLYIKALRIKYQLKDIEMKHLVYPFELPRIDIEENQMEKGVFIWSNIIDSSETAFIKQYLTYNKFDHVFIAGKQIDKGLEKKKTILRSFKGDGNLMIGNNNLINSNSPETYIDNIVIQYDSLLHGIHLDVEPHTFDDWKPKKAEYLEKYLSMVKRVKTYCDSNGLKLNISIPLHYDTTVVKQLFELVDHVDFMCYENIKQDYILRKISPYKLFPDKIGISIRTEDFKNKIDLQVYSLEISKVTGVKRINLHSLKRLIKQDEEYLNLK